MSAASTIAAVRDHPKVLRNSRETLTGRRDEWKARLRRRVGDEPLRRREIGAPGRDDCFYTFPCASGLIVVRRSCSGSRRHGCRRGSPPATSRRAARSVTSVDQLRGVSFVSSCAFSHRAPDDPIVYPGRPGASHDHTFLGSKTTDAYSTDATLRAAASTCKRRGETAAYWVPTLVSAGQPVLPAAASVYYRRDTIEEVKPFPPGLRMIAGSVRGDDARSRSR